MHQIPVIDLFAGPGGLSEGFSRHSRFMGNDVGFQVKLSIEKDLPAWKTLRLRSFTRQFPDGRLPDAYYDYLRSTSREEKLKRLDALKRLPEWEIAEHEAWHAELGAVDQEELNKRIDDALAGARHWVLLGGPPCQAYSQVGRSRGLGAGEFIRDIDDEEERDRELKKKKKTFYRDVRHQLYREYLKIVAVHQPSVFVMENVAGILSAKLPASALGDSINKDKKVFEQILSDLSDPWKAIESEGIDGSWWRYGSGESHKYKIHSFVKPQNPLTEGYINQDYLIRSEDFGVPQKRHRVILLGVRGDLSVNHVPLKKQEGKIALKSVIGDLPKLRSGRSRGNDSPADWVEAIRSAVSDEALATVEPSSVSSLMLEIRDRTRTTLKRGGGFLGGKCSLGNECGEELARWLSDKNLEGVIQHESRGHMDSDFARYLFVSAYGDKVGKSPVFKNFPEGLLPKHANAIREDKDGNKTLGKDFHDRFKVQVANAPSNTVVSHISKDGHYFIHYDPRQCRSLTVREVARIQTFPDNYFFEGNRTEQYLQVGNAVPPYLAVQLAGVVAEMMKPLFDEEVSCSRESQVKARAG